MTTPQLLLGLAACGPGVIHAVAPRAHAFAQRLGPHRGGGHRHRRRRARAAGARHRRGAADQSRVVRLHRAGARRATKTSRGAVRHVTCARARAAPHAGVYPNRLRAIEVRRAQRPRANRISESGGRARTSAARYMLVSSLRVRRIPRSGSCRWWATGGGPCRRWTAAASSAPRRRRPRRKSARCSRAEPSPPAHATVLFNGIDRATTVTARAASARTAFRAQSCPVFAAEHVHTRHIHNHTSTSTKNATPLATAPRATATTAPPRRRRRRV